MKTNCVIGVIRSDAPADDRTNDRRPRGFGPVFRERSALSNPLGSSALIRGETNHAGTPPRFHTPSNPNRHMIESMFSNPPEDAPDPTDTSFSDVTHAHGTTTWAPLLDSCQRIVNQLRATGELSSGDIFDLAEPPRTVSNREQFESYVWKRVCPTVATHPQVRWSDCWKFDPENALSADDLESFISGFNIDANHNTRAADNVEEDPRIYYPRVIKGWYDLLRETYEADTPRHGIASDELTANAAIVLPERHYQDCAEYLVEFPDIQPPARTTDRPDWSWIEADANESNAATSEVES